MTAVSTACSQPANNSHVEWHVLTSRVAGHPEHGWVCKGCGQEWADLPAVEDRVGCPRVRAAIA